LWKTPETIGKQIERGDETGEARINRGTLDCIVIRLKKQIHLSNE
jgi:hypothetical protein